LLELKILNFLFFAKNIECPYFFKNKNIECPYFLSKIIKSPRAPFFPRGAWRSLDPPPQKKQGAAHPPPDPPVDGAQPDE
jgi:hypothetical protein